MRNIVLILVLFFGTASVVHADLSPTVIRKLSKMPGVTKKTSLEDGESVTTWQKAGVTVTVKNGTVALNDNSGNGAIYCSRSIYIMARSAALGCLPSGDQSFINELGKYISAIDRFIVRNSLEPVSLSKLHADEAKQAEVIFKKLRSKNADELALVCRPDGQFGQLIAYMKDQPISQRKKALDTLLSVPRWPALNPCLWEADNRSIFLKLRLGWFIHRYLPKVHPCHIANSTDFKRVLAST